MDENNFWEIEEMFWLGDVKYYEQHLSDNSWMVFALPVGILDRNQIITNLSQGPRWESVILSQRKFQIIENNVLMLSYHATAERKDLDGPYKAFCSSGYRIDDKNWWLFFHQQTPV